MCKCSAKIHKDVAPMFIVQSENVSSLDDKYATVQFISKVELTYRESRRIFQPTELVQLPYPVIRSLYDALPAQIQFRKPKEELIFKEVYQISA